MIGEEGSGLLATDCQPSVQGCTEQPRREGEREDTADVASHACCVAPLLLFPPVASSSSAMKSKKACPLASRIKRLMQKDDDVGKIASASPIMIGTWHATHHVTHHDRHEARDPPCDPS